MSEGRTAATAADDRERQTQRSAARQNAGALNAFDALINRDAGPAQRPPTRRELDPDGFALDFARYAQQRRQRPGGFVLEPGRSLGELEVLAQTGELYNKELLGCLLRGRLAALISAADTTQVLMYVTRALRNVPDWAIESPDERDERLNATAGVRVEETRRAREEKRGIEAAARTQAAGTPDTADTPDRARATDTAEAATPPAPDGLPSTETAMDTAEQHHPGGPQRPAMNRAQRRALDARSRKR